MRAKSADWGVKGSVWRKLLLLLLSAEIVIILEIIPKKKKKNQLFLISVQNGDDEMRTERDKYHQRVRSFEYANIWEFSKRFYTGKIPSYT